MTPEEELYQCLREYDALMKKIMVILGKPHALTNIRTATKMFYDAEKRFPDEMHEALAIYLSNSTKQERLGQALYGSD